MVALEVLYDSASDELEVAFRRCEANKRATVDEWRARNAGMYLGGAGFEECLHVVAELGAAIQ